ncbi:hypothetical protein SVAN01_00118 [Stagonosporopsis vannaccii]|nr:hypothetical protein SVAN01_00118 [Stagonosporopsis vannaccii]
MRSAQYSIGLAALMATIPAISGQVAITSTSAPSNFSLTSVRTLTPTLLPTGPNFCCGMLADGVGLNFWWSSTRGGYTATVVTSYIQYDNTVLTELATITNPGAPIGSIPNDIIPTHNVYRGTTLANQSTIASYPTTIIASPTPHIVVNAFIFFTGSQTTNTIGASSCSFSGGTVDRFGLRTPYIYVEDPPVTRTDGAMLPGPPTDIVDQIIIQNPTVTIKYPYLTDCPIESGTGQPTVHIPVTALTSQSSTTIRRQGDAPVPTTSNGSPTTQESETSEPAPGPSTIAVEPSSTSNRPETPPTTQAPSGPEPTTPTNPPSSTVVDPPSPPEDTQAPPENTQPPPQNTQAPPQNTQAPPEDTQAPPANSQSPPDSDPTTAGNQPSSVFITPPAPGNTQPTAGPVAPSNTLSLPFSIVPVPVPTVAPTNDAPSTDDSPPAGGNPTSTPNPGAVVLPGDQTLNPGQQTTLSGVVISVPSLSVPDSDATAPVVIIDGATSTVTVVQPTAPPLVVIDGTTVTLPVAAPTEDEQQPPVVPVTLGTQVLTLEAPSASGEGVVLPNSETLELGSTTVVEGQTVMASVVTSGTRVATVIEVVGESTTQVVTLPTVTPTESGDESEETSSVTGTRTGITEFTGGAVSMDGANWGWGMFYALGLVVLGLA